MWHIEYSLVWWFYLGAHYLEEDGLLKYRIAMPRKDESSGIETSAKV